MPIQIPTDYQKAIDWKLEPIPNFAFWEMACKCGCGLVILDPELLYRESLLRLEFDKPITATSWTRCFRHNLDVGGAVSSYHQFGKALDQKPKHGILTDHFIFLCRKYFPYVEVHHTFCHTDIRGPRRLGK